MKLLETNAARKRQATIVINNRMYNIKTASLW